MVFMKKQEKFWFDAMHIITIDILGKSTRSQQPIQISPPVKPIIESWFFLGFFHDFCLGCFFGCFFFWLEIGFWFACVVNRAKIFTWFTILLTLCSFDCFFLASYMCFHF